MNLSIIVPVLNEAQALPGLLEHLLPLRQPGVEVILVDGDSEDGGAAMAARVGFRVLRAERGRARQMNVGAAVASGDVLMFLHADTRLPQDALQAMEKSLLVFRRDWGRFDVRIAGESAMLKVIATCMNWRSRLTGIATGDQATFLTRAAFERVGGFPEQPLMEDIELSRRLKRCVGPPACLRQRVTTSGRRWESRGLWRTIFLMWRLRLAYWLGYSAEALAKAYR